MAQDSFQVFQVQIFFHLLSPFTIIAFAKDKKRNVSEVGNSSFLCDMFDICSSYQHSSGKREGGKSSIRKRNIDIII